MYQQQFKSTPLFERLVKPFIEKLPQKPGAKLTVMYPDIRTFSSVRQQWYNWIHHHACGLFTLSHTALTKPHYWGLVITRTTPEDSPQEVI